MQPISYDAVAPNIADVRVSGATVTVTWKDAQTGRQVGESSATMSADDSMAGRVKSSMKRSIVSEVTTGAARFLGNLLGGAAGRVVNNVAWTTASDVRSRADASLEYTEASRRAAIVAAFASVEPSFSWNEQAGRFEAR
jgi:hypothetical protein